MYGSAATWAVVGLWCFFALPPLAFMKNGIPEGSRENVVTRGTLPSAINFNHFSAKGALERGKVSKVVMKRKTRKNCGVEPIVFHSIWSANR
jgi:hypothetical protein